MHCSRVFRSSVPSDLLPSSPCGRPSGAAQGECGSTRSMEWGVGPGAACQSTELPGRADLEGMFRGRSALRGGSYDASSRIGRTCSARRDAPGICIGTMARAAWTRGRARAAGRKLRRLLTQGALGASPGSSSGSASSPRGRLPCRRTSRRPARNAAVQPLRPAQLT